MTCHVYDEDTGEFIEELDIEPECGEDFCDTCGDCLYCCGEEECQFNDDGKHLFVRYRKSGEGI